MKSRYRGLNNFEHGRMPRLGIVLVNLGTPTAPTAQSLRRYLGEFLDDPRVVEIPRPLWKIILHGIILRVRPRKSAQAYASVWTDSGSPLRAHSQALVEAVREQLQTRFPGPVQVELAMRYGEPAIDKVLVNMQAQGVERILIVPLYPQYSGATTGSVADSVFASLGRWRWVPELRMAGAYHDDPGYIEAIAESIRAHRETHGAGNKLLISFHGMPEATLKKGDPYHCHCRKTARLIAEELGLLEHEWEVAFQSRFGRAAWLQPYVVERLEALPGEGVRRLSVICPGFSADCLETLEEIEMQGRELFLQAGGERLDYIPCLNASAAHVQFHAQRIAQHAAGWPETSADFDMHRLQAALEVSRQQAHAAGAQDQGASQDV